MQIVVAGHICIDNNTTEHAVYTAAGGPAIFMQKIFSQLPGVKSTIVAPHGFDFLPYAQNIPLYPPTPSTKHTLVYENTIIQGMRRQKALHRESATPIPLDKALKQQLTACDMLFLTPLLPNFSPAYVQKVLQLLPKGALVVLLPQGYYRDFDADNQVISRQFRELQNIVPLVDIVVVSEQDGDDMENKARGWSSTYDCVSVVTMREKGAIAFQKGKSIFLPTKAVPKEKVIDSVGSGDIFSAGFGYAYKKTASVQKAGKFANAIARQRLFFSTADIRFAIPAL